MGDCASATTAAKSFWVSNGRSGKSAAAPAWPLLARNRLVPSGSAFATIAAATVPPAPGLFCTTTGRPVRAWSCSATMRARVSAGPPGAKPT